MSSDEPQPQEEAVRSRRNVGRMMFSCRLIPVRRYFAEFLLRGDAAASCGFVFGLAAVRRLPQSMRVEGMRGAIDVAFDPKSSGACDSVLALDILVLFPFLPFRRR